MSWDDHGGSVARAFVPHTGDEDTALAERLRTQAAAEFVNRNDTAAQLLRDAYQAITRLISKPRPRGA